MEKIPESRGRFEGGREELMGDSFEKNDSPGTDSYDDGLGADGKLKMPGSTVHEGAPNYAEHKGPNDLTNREGAAADVLGELDPEITITRELPSQEDDQAGDAADKWLRAHDPKWGK